MQQTLNIDILFPDVVGQYLTTAHQDYPELWDSDDLPEGNRESQIPMRHGQTVNTAFKKLATFQTLQRIDRAFDAMDGSVVRRLWDHLGQYQGWSRYAFSAQESPLSVTTLLDNSSTDKLFNPSSKHHKNKIGVFSQVAHG